MVCLLKYYHPMHKTFRFYFYYYYGMQHLAADGGA